MHHQALFHPLTGGCEMGPCKGEKLLKYEAVELNNNITILETRFRKKIPSINQNL